MKNLYFILFFFLLVGVNYGSDSNRVNNTSWKTNAAVSVAAAPDDSSTVEREKPRRHRRNNVETFLNPKGWQSGIGYKEMQRYLKRLAHLCEERIPGLVNGIAAGKRGILINVTFKGQKSFYMAQENTKEFLTAIIGDLEKMPEHVSLAVYVIYDKRTIIKAMKSKGKVKVKFLL